MIQVSIITRRLMNWVFTLFLSQQPSQLKHFLQGFYVASKYLKRHMSKPLPQLNIVNLVSLFSMFLKKTTILVQ